MDEEEKLPLFGVQPEDFYNTEGQGTMGDAMLGGAGLTGAAFAAQTGRAPTPPPSGQMSSLAQRVAANDAANRLARTTQPQLIGQGQISGPGRPVPGTQLSVPGTQVPAITGTGTQMVPSGATGVVPGGATPETVKPIPRGTTLPTVSGDFTPDRPLGQGPASKITTGILSGMIGAPSLVLAPTSMGDATTSGSLESLAQRYMAGGMDFADAYSQASQDLNIPIGGQRTVEQVIEAKNLRGPATVAPQVESAPETEGSVATPPGGGGFGSAYNPFGLPAARPDTVTPLQEIGAVLRGPFTPSPEALEAIEARGEGATPGVIAPMETAEPAVPSTAVAPEITPAGPAYGGTVVGTTPGGAIEFAPEGEGLIRTMDPTSGEVVFADPSTVARFAEQFREQQLADRAAQQAAITSPEGRAMTERMLGQAIQGGGEFAAESAAREARIAARPDFMEARPSAARQAGGMSMAQARKLSGGDSDVARRMVELSRMGRDPLTGKLMETPAEKALETEAAKSRIAYYNTLVEKAQKEDPDKLSIIEGYADRLGLTGEPRQTFIFGQLGGADIGDILGPGFTVETDDSVSVPTPTITSQEQYDALPSGSQYYDSAGKLATKK